MAAPDTPAETFKRALGHAARALAEQPELEVVFASDGPRVSGGVLTLPHPPRDPSGPESASLRGQADRLALRLANHDEAADRRLRPADAQAADVFDAAEQARVEAVGSEFLAGVRGNLDAALLTRLERTGALRAAEAERVPLPEAVGLLVRERLTGRAAPDGARAMLDLVRANLEARAGGELDALAAVAGDQAAFAARLKAVLRALDLDPGDGKGDDASEDPGDQEPDPQDPKDDSDEDQDEEEDGGEGSQSMEGSADEQTSEDERESRPEGAPADPDGQASDEAPELNEGEQPNRQQTADEEEEGAGHQESKADAGVVDDGQRAPAARVAPHLVELVVQLVRVGVGGASVTGRGHGASVSSQSASWPRVSSGMSSWRGMAMPCLML